jgi:hypothetical protein
MAITNKAVRTVISIDRLNLANPGRSARGTCYHVLQILAF